MHKSDFTHLLRITIQLLAELDAISPFGINQLTLLHKSGTPLAPSTSIKFSAELHLLLSGICTCLGVYSDSNWGYKCHKLACLTTNTIDTIWKMDFLDWYGIRTLVLFQPPHYFEDHTPCVEHPIAGIRSFSLTFLKPFDNPWIYLKFASFKE